MYTRFALSISMSLALAVMPGYLYPGLPVGEAAAGPVITQMTTNLAEYPDGEVPRYE